MDRAGNLTDLGTLGGQLAFGMHINKRDEVAGDSTTAAGADTGFFWSRNSGMVPVNVSGGGSRLVSGLNGRGEVVGDTDIGGQSIAYQWTLARGAVTVPSGSAVRSDVFDINDHSDMVGAIERPASEGGGLHAVRWAGLNPPIDLNTRLYRAPAGLVVEAAAAINEDGVILAHSNAGLVMLRPGKRGTDAPVLGPIVNLPRSVTLNDDLTLTVGLIDNAATQTHKASVLWTDGCASPAPTVSEANGTGQVRLQHRFCAAGYQSVKVKVTDSGGRWTELQQDIIVDDPALTSLSGKGTLDAAPVPSGQGLRKQPLQFSLGTPLANSAGANTASTARSTATPNAARAVLMLSGPFLFRSDQVSSAVSNGAQVRVEGTGNFNGRSGYRFQIDARPATAQQAGSRGQLRVRLSHQDARSGAQVIDYDNGAAMIAKGAAGATTASTLRATPARDGTALSDGSLTLRN